MGANLTYGSGNDRYRLQGAELNPIGTTYYNKHKDRKLSYNADRKPVDVHDVGNGRITFNYSHDGHRQEVWYGGEDATKTDRQYHKTYSRIAPIELVRDTENNSVKFMTYVGGDAYTAAVVHVQDSDSSKPSGHHYLHRDYLGSILAVSNSAGKVIERAHFGAWGDVAVISTGSITGTEDPELVEGTEAAIAFADSLTGRGFTGHEHFTEVGLVHMNGRMYDAQQGRFLSPDNHIQDPFNTQNFNRFGYGFNNPLNGTDVSGEIFGIDDILIAVAIALTTNGISNTINGEGFFKNWGQAVVIGVVSAGFAYGIGDAALGIKGTFLSTGIGTISNASVFQFVAHGALGGFMSAAQGGKFGAGFLSGGFGSAFGGKMGKWLQNARDFPKFIGTTIAGGISGGIGSRIAGGKFWDGFRNGAISAGLNHAAHSLQQRISEYFETKKAAYDYAVDESILLELENGYTIEREVSGFALENGDYVVQDPTNNTRMKSFNEIIVKGGKNYVRHNGNLYQIKSQFHTHPSGMNYTKGVGVSRADLSLMNNTLNGAPMSILYRGNEWIISQGNQFSKHGYNYSLTNNGTWK